VNDKTKEIIKEIKQHKGGISMHKKSAPIYLKLFQKASKSLVLDVGCGRGYLAKILHSEFGFKFKIFGIDVFDKYLPKSNEYEKIFVSSIIDTFKDAALQEFDIYCFIDVLEHMEKVQSVEIIQHFLEKKKKILISIPVGSKHYKQPEEYVEENSFEAHLHDWTVEEAIREFGLRLIGEHDDIAILSNMED